MVEVVVTTGATRHAKFHSNHNYQRPRANVLQAGCHSCQRKNLRTLLKYWSGQTQECLTVSFLICYRSLLLKIGAFNNNCSNPQDQRNPAACTIMHPRALPSRPDNAQQLTGVVSVCLAWAYSVYAVGGRPLNNQVFDRVQIWLQGLQIPPYTHSATTCMFMYCFSSQAEMTRTDGQLMHG